MRTAINHRIGTSIGAFAVADHGAGTPVVLWPSLFSDHRLYDRVVALLGGGWRTIRIDGPGFGRSDAPAGDVPASRYADAVAEVLDSLTLGSAFVAGCSWGGQIAAHFAVQHPRRASGVLLMNTPLAPNPGGPGPLAPATRWFGSSALFGRGVARSMTSVTSRREHPDRITEFVSAFRSFERVPASTTVRTVLGRSAGLGDLLPRIAAPAAFLMGADDSLCPADQLLPIARTTPGADVEIVPGCGHLAPLEAPETVVRMLTELAGR